MSALRRQRLCLVLLLTVLWAVSGTRADQPQPSADTRTESVPDQLLSLVVGVTSEIRPLVNRLANRIDGLDSRLSGFDSRLNGIQARLNALDFKQDSVDSRLNELASDVASANNRLVSRVDELISQANFSGVRFDSRLDELASDVASADTELSSRLNELASDVASPDSRLDSRLNELVSRVNTTESRFDTRLVELVSRVDSADSGFDSRLNELVSRVDSADSGLDSRLDELATQLEMLANMTSQEQDNKTDPRIQIPPLPRDCSELPSRAQSGIYLLQVGLNRSGPVAPAFCDMNTDGGRWTVFQRRADIEPRLSFNRTWSAYKDGFGELDAEFWWGLEKLWLMTGPADRQYELRVDLADFEGERRYAVYRQFRVASEANGYRLTVDHYSGDAGDSFGRHGGHQFSTIDRDQDTFNENCAQLFSSGWWFRRCYSAHLNAPYMRGERESGGKRGINWNFWRGDNYSLKESEMKIRPVNAD